MSKKQKIAFIITHPIQYYVPLLQELTRRGNLELRVFYTWGESSVKKFDPGFGREIEWDIPLLDGYAYEFLHNKAADPGSHHFSGIDNPDIIKRINDYHPDKLFVFGWSYKSHLKVLRYFKGKIPVYFRGDSHLLGEQSAIKKIVRNLFLRWIYKHVDFAVSVGTSNRQYFRAAGLREDQVLFAPHAVDDQAFSDEAGSFRLKAAELRRSLGIPSGDIVFLYAGKFEAVKNLGFMIDAFVKADVPGAHLLLVGNGEDEPALKAMKNDGVHFMDFQNQRMMPAIYRMADVFILSSFSETWGLSVNEAMHCGLALLLHKDIGCAPDLLQPGYNGYLYQKGNRKDMSDKMEKMSEDKQKTKEMGDHSLVIINDWNYRKLTDRLERILAE